MPFKLISRNGANLMWFGYNWCIGLMGVNLEQQPQFSRQGGSCRRRVSVIQPLGVPVAGLDSLNSLRRRRGNEALKRGQSTGWMKQESGPVCVAREGFIRSDVCALAVGEWGPGMDKFRIKFRPTFGDKNNVPIISNALSFKSTGLLRYNLY